MIFDHCSARQVYRSGELDLLTNLISELDKSTSLAGIASQLVVSQLAS